LKESRVVAAGKMAIMWSIWGATLVAAVYIIVWLAVAGYGLWALVGFAVWTIASGLFVFNKFFSKLAQAKKLTPGGRNDWILVLTFLAFAFAMGAAFQTVSTINSQTVSLTSCVSPPKTNVTSPNCIQVQTIAHVEGPFLYYSQLGLSAVGLGVFAAFVFGITYLALLRLPSLLSDE
jgi:hypothetical protein